MILHSSFAVDAPQSAAETLALLLGGEAFPFPELSDGAWIAMSGDAHGTLVEFLERGTEFHYVPGRAVAYGVGEKTRESACHVLIETTLDEDRVLSLAAERGCRAHRARHGPLDVIEFWLEGCLLIEVATPQMAAAYRAMATLENVRSMITPRQT